MNYSQKFGFFEQIWMKFVTLKVGEPHEVILGDFPFFMEQARCAKVF